MQWQFWTTSVLHRLGLRLTELVAKEEQKRGEGKYGPNGAEIKYNSSADAKLEKELDSDANKHAGGKEGGRQTETVARIEIRFRYKVDHQVVD